jgi:hypothetical protein
MTRKRSKTQCVKPTRSPPGARTEAGAHPRLVHGYLVHCGARCAVPIAAEISGLQAFAAILVRTRTPSPDGAGREGATDGATFH